MVPALPKYVFLNGPPGSGKSTLAKLIAKNNDSVWLESFAQPIRDMIYTVFYPNEGPVSFSFDLRDESAKRDLLLDTKLTRREAMISFSQTWMKPLFGEDIFGRLLHARCEDQEQFYSNFVIDDAGFYEELQYIVEKEGPNNCLLIRLRREGCDFMKDSRSYLFPSTLRSIDLENNSTTEEMLDNLTFTLTL